MAPNDGSNLQSEANKLQKAAAYESRAIFKPRCSVGTLRWRQDLPPGIDFQQMTAEPRRSAMTVPSLCLGYFAIG